MNPTFGAIQRLKAAGRSLARFLERRRFVAAAVIWPWETEQGRVQPQDYSSQVGAYKSWVYSCVSRNANTAAAVPLRLYVARSRDASGAGRFAAKAVQPERRLRLEQNAGLGPWLSKASEIEELVEHPFLRLLRQVNPFMNRFGLWQTTLTFLELTGNCYWHVVGNALGVPAEIWVQPSQNMKIVPDPERWIGGYVFEQSGKKARFAAEEIIHFKYPNPKDPFYGMSPLEAAADAVNLSQAMTEYEQALFENRGEPGGVLQSEKPLSNDEFERLRQQWLAAHRGTRKAGAVAVLEAGVEWRQIAASPREISYLGGRKWTREEIADAFGVPMALLTSEDVNLANAREAKTSYLMHTIVPRLRMIEEKLNEQLLPRYDERLFCAFDNPAPEERQFLLSERETHLRAGLTTINEEREKLGLRPVPWGDAPLRNA